MSPISALPSEQQVQLFYDLVKDFPQELLKSMAKVDLVWGALSKAVNDGFKLQGAEFASSLGHSLSDSILDALNNGDKDAVVGKINAIAEAVSKTFSESFAHSAVPAFFDEIVEQSWKLGVAGGVIVGLTMTAGVVSYYGWTRWFEQPKLINEERRLTGLSCFYRTMTNKVSLAWGKKPEKKIFISPVFNEDISRKIKDFTKGITHLQRNDGYFQNALFYGPGGVGKTMICDKIAEDANVNFIKMSGGNLAECFTKGTHVVELNKLFDYIEASSLPTVLFIDEAEALSCDRKLMKGEEALKRLELIDAFLNRTGAPSKKIILLLATNLVKNLDPAVLSRMDYQFRIDPPALPERLKMISDYIPKFFTGKDRDLFTQEKVEWFANKTEGFTGRNIFKMFNRMNVKKAGTARNQLTVQIIEETVLDWIAEKNDFEKI